MGWVHAWWGVGASQTVDGCGDMHSGIGAIDPRVCRTRPRVSHAVRVGTAAAVWPRWTTTALGSIRASATTTTSTSWHLSLWHRSVSKLPRDARVVAGRGRLLAGLAACLPG